MEKPEIAQRAPCVLTLEAGTYWWCECGRSSNQPWCDGSHKGTDFRPQRFELEEGKLVAMCACKYSEKKPLCDGTHKRL